MTSIPTELLIDEHPRRWNAWRQRHGEDSVDLGGVNLAGKALFGANLSGVNLVGATLVGCDLTDVDFYRAYLSGANLSAATLTGATLTGANLGAATLHDANLTDATLTRATLNSADFTGADLTGANLTEATLFRVTIARATLTNANVIGANLVGADLSRSVFDGANLTDANLTGADLTGANLSHTDLTHANLSHADLTGANLSRADLTGTTLDGANLSRANLDGANLTHADLTHANLTDATLSRALGLSGVGTELLFLPDDAVAAVRLEVEMGAATPPADLAAVMTACTELCRLATTLATPYAVQIAAAHLRYERVFRLDLTERRLGDESSSAPDSLTAGTDSRIVDLLEHLARLSGHTAPGDHTSLPHRRVEILPIDDAEFRHRIADDAAVDTSAKRALEESTPMLTPLLVRGISVEIAERIRSGD
ncbi:pentapeptide repeat-containing protein [Gordonia sp. CPCC 205515]|uniref:pentapeptide repeat-containing protein n=1 Tax=Gordonia sp. CPCC 205515 TaxID=3140791 RepID=UPI003AF334E1